MRTAEDKENFILARAEGKSFSVIQKELGIAKGTCSSWETELKHRIRTLRTERLNELYIFYGMTREARIERLGDTLNNINEALEQIDLKTIPPEKLLDYKLKYSEALKEEYTDLEGQVGLSSDFTATDILNVLARLFERVKSGDITTQQAGKENIILTSILKAYENVEINKKLQVLETILGSRK